MKQAPTETTAHVNHARRPTVADVIDRVLDKGIVIEYHIHRMSLAGIDLPVTVDARCVAASLDTYLEYVEPLRMTSFLEGTNTLLRDIGIRRLPTSEGDQDAP
jgi:hypothetical protein